MTSLSDITDTFPKRLRLSHPAWQQTLAFGLFLKCPVFLELVPVAIQIVFMPSGLTFAMAQILGKPYSLIDARVITSDFAISSSASFTTFSFIFWSSFRV
ncbi:hypothetical protein SAMN06275492_1337 [Dethiosulfovibrio salsuginis]|uniref:Uncharacterized protein n=1 Tax=Dethiosulfovibrio salsuginis TaxID=561720 RepID=A0A1X7KNY1_9BACT|nr:hypothetical protein SAMN06275492_1337 [Dethiosulfovibrio salsuginis]